MKQRKKKRRAKRAEFFLGFWGQILDQNEWIFVHPESVGVWGASGVHWGCMDGVWGAMRVHGWVHGVWGMGGQACTRVHAYARLPNFLTLVE